MTEIIHLDTLDEVKESDKALVEHLEKQGVKYVMASWVDILGRPRAKCTPIKFLPDLIGGFARYTPRGITGIGETNPVEEEVTSRPDVSTLTILPWNRKYAWMVADMWSDKGEPFELDPRSILKKQIAKAEEQDLYATLGIEPEFYVYKPDSTLGERGFRAVTPAATVRPSPAYDVETVLDSHEFLDRMADMMLGCGLEPFNIGAEGGVGQYEIDFYYKPLLEMADRAILYKLMIRQVAKEFGLVATFMPKPFQDDWGSGAHFNLGLYRGPDMKKQDSVFRDINKKWTPEGLSFVAGVLRHMPAITAIANPMVNSYRRLTPRLIDGSVSWAPIKIAYGYNNRSCVIRLPENRAACELRSADASANPYLVSAFMLAAGLEGIKNKYDPGPAMEVLASDVETLPNLPATLRDAITEFQKDPLSEEVFSKNFVHDYVETKMQEWEKEHLRVVRYEREDDIHLV